MPTVKIHISDKQAGLLVGHAANEGISVDEFVGRKIGGSLAKTLEQASSQWPPISRWDEMVRGHNCPICIRFAQGGLANEEGFWIKDLAITRLQLLRNQFVPGYCVLTCFEHVREPYELSKNNQRLFFDDLMRAGRAIDSAMRPAKMNFEIQGNGVPHLHCHVKPRYHGDSAPCIPIDQNADTVLLSPDQYTERVNTIRSFL